MVEYSSNLCALWAILRKLIVPDVGFNFMWIVLLGCIQLFPCSPSSRRRWPSCPKCRSAVSWHRSPRQLLVRGWCLKSHILQNRDFNHLEQETHPFWGQSDWNSAHWWTSGLFSAPAQSPPAGRGAPISRVRGQPRLVPLIWGSAHLQPCRSSRSSWFWWSSLWTEAFPISAGQKCNKIDQKFPLWGVEGRRSALN